ncbi:MAG: radical SAM protein [Dehalococcoidia bacterium]|nr:radical SAM protein [Dehalococcoidia bacterium]
MLTGLHFLLSYKCDSECDHCFVYSGPQATGTFTLAQVKDALSEAARIGTVEMVYFEGGEPFLFYPLMLEGIRTARDLGFKTGIVTNAYWATSEEDAELWLRPLRDLGLSDMSISDDAFHYEGEDASPARRALSAAGRLGLPCGSISIDQPRIEEGADEEQLRGKSVIAGGAVLRGRAVEKLAAGLPRRPWQEFTECPDEDLRNPGRVHLDSYGNVHLCQGLSMGNMWDVPLSQLVSQYDADLHPVCRPLLQGGPAQLVAEYEVSHEDAYVDACHLCYLARRALLDSFPQYLAPGQVYGLG